jgi:hypothetical protein
MTTSLAEFHRYWDDTEALKWLVAAQIMLDPQRVASQSRETTTHFKWLLACDRSHRRKIWLHEFKPACERRPGYASTVHNHRYPFTVVTLSGGYTNKRYRVAYEETSLRVTSCDVVRSEELLQGSTYSMQPDEYHSVDDIEDGTQTLIMEQAAVTTASYSLELEQRGDRMTKHVPLEVRVRSLLEVQTPSTRSGTT